MNNESPKYETAPDDEIDLRELIITLLKGWKIIVVTTVVVTILAGIYAARQKDQFVVTTKAATVGSSGGSQMAGLAALAGVQMSSGNGDIDLLSHIDVVIKNSYFMDNILSKKWEIPRKQSKSDIKKGVRAKLDTLSLAEYWGITADTSLPDGEYRYKMKLYGKLRSPKTEYITVSMDKGILEVNTKFDNAALAYGVHQELLRLLKEYLSNDYSSKNRESRIFLQKRVAEVKGSLSSAEAQLKNLKQSNFIDLAPRIALDRGRLEREIALQSGLYAELSKQLEMAKIEEKKDTPVFEVLQEGELPLNPSEPNRKLLVAIGMILGLALGIFAVFAKEWVRSIVTSPTNKPETKEVLK